MATLAQEEEDRLRELMESSGMPNRSGTIGPSRGSVRGFSVVDADRRQQARPSGDPLYGNAINPIVANAIKEEQLRIERERIAAAERESQGNLDLKRQAQEADNQVRGQELRLKGGALKNDYDINRRRVDFDYDKLNSDVNADNLNRVQREYLASMDDQMTREGWQEQRGRDLNAWKQDSVRTLESEISQRLKSLDGKELTGVGKEQYNRLLGGLRAIQKGRATNIPQVQSEMLAK